MRALIATIILAAACGGGGKYATSDREAGDVDRGETNGRSLDFTSNLPDGEDWQVRVRDSSMWAAYSEGETNKRYEPVNLDKKETAKFWELVDALNMPDRKKGKLDDDEGYVTIRVREPGGEEGHESFTTNVSRATNDEDVIALAAYLQKLIKKYHKVDADF